MHAVEPDLASQCQSKHDRIASRAALRVLLFGCLVHAGCGASTGKLGASTDAALPVAVHYCAVAPGIRLAYRPREDGITLYLEEVGGISKYPPIHTKIIRASEGVPSMPVELVLHPKYRSAATPARTGSVVMEVSDASHSVDTEVVYQRSENERRTLQIGRDRGNRLVVRGATEVTPSRVPLPDRAVRELLTGLEPTVALARDGAFGSVREVLQCKPAGPAECHAAACLLESARSSIGVPADASTLVLQVRAEWRGDDGTLYGTVQVPVVVWEWQPEADSAGGKRVQVGAPGFFDGVPLRRVGASAVTNAWPSGRLVLTCDQDGVLPPSSSPIGTWDGTVFIKIAE